MTQTLLFLLVVGIGLFYAFKYGNKAKKEITEKTQQTKKVPEQNPYLDMREMAFSAKADQIGLENIADNKVYGLITEMSMNPGSASVISFLTGDTSLYLSSGGGFIGAGQHEEVRKMVTEKVDGFQKYLSKAEKINYPELPKDGMVTFNFLTKSGIYSKTEKTTELESGKSDLSILFAEVNDIITAIRLKSN